MKVIAAALLSMMLASTAFGKGKTTTLYDIIARGGRAIGIETTAGSILRRGVLKGLITDYQILKFKRNATDQQIKVLEVLTDSDKEKIMKVVNVNNLNSIQFEIIDQILLDNHVQDYLRLEPVPVTPH